MERKREECRIANKGEKREKETSLRLKLHGEEWREKRKERAGLINQTNIKSNTNVLLEFRHVSKCNCFMYFLSTGTFFRLSSFPLRTSVMQLAIVPAERARVLTSYVHPSSLTLATWPHNSNKEPFTSPDRPTDERTHCVCGSQQQYLSLRP